MPLWGSIAAGQPIEAIGLNDDVVPINAAGSPQTKLPAGLPDSGFAERPLPAQLPSPLHPPG